MFEKFKNLARFALGLAAEQGAEAAHCTVSENELREFNVDGGEFSLFRTTFGRSLSISLFLGHRKGSVTINRFDEEAIREAVSNCIATAQSGQPDSAWEIASGIGEKSFSAGALEPDVDKLFFRAEELLESIKERHPLIIMEQMIVSHAKRSGVYMSTTGNSYEFQSGRYTAELMYSAHKGEKSTSFFGSDVTVYDLDTPFIDCALIDRELTDVENQLDTISPEGKFEGRVIFAPGCLVSTVFHNICYNFASDTTILDSTSVWKDKLGQTVADERINVSFRIHDKRIPVSEFFTGEGYISEDFDFIKNGRLESFLLSQYVANKTGNSRAKNTSFSIVIEPGETPLEDIIKSTERGLLIGRFSGGSPGTNGEFSGVAKNGFLIEKGKIVSAISETMISGNLAEMLFNLAAISKEALIDGSVVAPYMAFDKITISGK